MPVRLFLLVLRFLNGQTTAACGEGKSHVRLITPR